MPAVGPGGVDLYNSDKTAQAIQDVLDRNDWSYTDHHNDIVCDHSDNGLNLDEFWNIRHRNTVWDLIVKDILKYIIMNISNSPKPKLKLVFDLVVQRMNELCDAKA